MRGDSPNEEPSPSIGAGQRAGLGVWRGASEGVAAKSPSTSANQNRERTHRQREPVQGVKPLADLPSREESRKWVPPIRSQI